MLGAIATVQIVLTVALLTGAALLIRTSMKLASVNPGYEIDNIMAVTVTTVTPNSFLPFHTQVLERVAALPGVSHAAFAWGVPLTGNKWPGNIEFVGRPGTAVGQVSFPLRSVTARLLRVDGDAIVAGRAFTDDDNSEAPRVMVVNQSLANRYFSGAIRSDSRLQFAGDAKRQCEIVGVVADTRTDALSQARGAGDLSAVLAERRVLEASGRALAVRAAGLFALVRREVHAVDPTASVEHATTMAQIRRESLAPRTFAMRLLIGFSVVATALALVGIYGVLSLSVGSRLKEIAVRKAIGAQQQDILRSVLGEGGRMIRGWCRGRRSRRRRVGPRARDAAVRRTRSRSDLARRGGIGFGVIALVACLLPALRAARTDLVSALHHE